MKKFRIKSWQCETENPELIKNVIDGFSNISKDNIIRNNKNRTVYRIKVNKKYYFVKLIHPKLFRHKLRELLFFTKSYSEYKSAMFLEKIGLEVVHVEGWGKRWHKNFLVTEDAGLNVVNARDFWLQTASKNSYVREEFLNSLSYFLRKCIYANFVHPDFHLGNLLLKVTKDDLKFIFVDPDGVKFKTKKIDLIKQGIGELLSSIITSELSKEEAVKLLKDSNIISSEEDYDKIWTSFRKYNVEFVKSRWKKRKRKLLAKKSRFSERFIDTQSNNWYLRKDNYGECILNKDLLDIDLLSKSYATEVLSFEGAKWKWLLSYYMQFLSIPHVMPIALYADCNKQESILIYERFDQSVNDTISVFDIEMMKKLCETAGIKVQSYEDSIVYKGKRPLLKEYSYSGHL